MRAQELKGMLNTPLDPIEMYKEEMIKMMSLSFPNVYEEDIKAAVEASVKKRFQDVDCTLYNNYKGRELNTTLYNLTKYIESKKPIVTSFGVLFARHGDIENPMYDFVQELAEMRVKYKNEMLRHPKGSEEYNRYNLLQSLAKIDMNSLYGSMGSPTSIFFNMHVAPAITAQGRALISASIVFFEAFLSNNLWFGSMEEVETYIYNIITEQPYRQFKDEELGVRNVTVEETLFNLLKNCGYFWAPSKKEGLVLYDQLTRLSQEDLNRVYYKNNLEEFCKTPKIVNLITNTLITLDSPFLNPNKPPKEISEHLKLLLDYLKEYVYYEYPFIDKMDKVTVMPRDSVLIVDTDSCIISLENWFRFISQFIKGIDMSIRHMSIDVFSKIEVDEFGDRPPIKVMEIVDDCYDYDFYTDKLIETKRKINPMKMIPEDGLRSSIINIISYILSQLILDYMQAINVRDHSSTPDWPDLMIMKNEYLFKSILLGFVKKHYASYVLVQEGHMVPKENALAITGFELDKVGTPKSTSDRMKRILFEQILDTEDGVDQLQVLNSLSILEKQIYDSLLKGETKFYKPAKIKAARVYKDPMTQQGIKASYAYNNLKLPGEPLINLDENNSVIIIKTKIDKKVIEKIKETDPEFYAKAMKLLNMENYKNGITSVAIHFDDPVPQWVIPYINYQEIIQNNLNSFPLESIGIQKVSNDFITTSNIVSL